MFKTIDSNDSGNVLVQVLDEDDSVARFESFFAELKALLSKHRVHMIAEDFGMTTKNGCNHEYEAHIEFTQYNGNGKYNFDDIGFVAEATDIWPDNTVFSNGEELLIA